MHNSMQRYGSGWLAGFGLHPFKFFMVVTKRLSFHTYLVVLFCLLTGPVVAQLNNKPIGEQHSSTAEPANSYGLSLQLFNYMRNTEYFNRIELGRTLFGYQFHPSFYVQPEKQLNIKAGVFMRHDFGGVNPYTQVLPTLSLTINSKNGNRWIFGTLEGALAHRLIEPLYDINSIIERRIENGFQFRRQTEHSFYDVWINWEKFIERQSPYQEQFSGGLHLNRAWVLHSTYAEANTKAVSLDSSVSNLRSQWTLAPIVQFTARHKGGQIDTDSANMIMQLNGAAGLRLAYTNPTQSLLHHAFADAYVVGYRESTNSGYFPFRQGTGLYANAAVASKAFTLMLSYWQGNKYLSPLGTALYQSSSVDKPYTEKQRKLLFVRLIYDKEVYPGLHLSARAEPVYDIKNRILDYAYSLYLSYGFTGVFGKLKNK